MAGSFDRAATVALDLAGRSPLSEKATEMFVGRAVVGKLNRLQGTMPVCEKQAHASVEASGIGQAPRRPVTLVERWWRMRQSRRVSQMRTGRGDSSMDR